MFVRVGECSPPWVQATSARHSSSPVPCHQQQRQPQTQIQPTHDTVNRWINRCVPCLVWLHQAGVLRARTGLMPRAGARDTRRQAGRQPCRQVASGVLCDALGLRHPNAGRQPCRQKSSSRQLAGREPHACEQTAMLSQAAVRGQSVHRFAMSAACAVHLCATQQRAGAPADARALGTRARGSVPRATARPRVAYLPTSRITRLSSEVMPGRRPPPAQVGACTAACEHLTGARGRQGREGARCASTAQVARAAPASRTAQQRHTTQAPTASPVRRPVACEEPMAGGGPWRTPQPLPACAPRPGPAPRRAVPRQLTAAAPAGGQAHLIGDAVGVHCRVSIAVALLQVGACGVCACWEGGFGGS